MYHHLGHFPTLGMFGRAGFLLDTHIHILHMVGGLEHVLFVHILGIIIPTEAYFSEG